MLHHYLDRILDAVRRDTLAAKYCWHMEEHDSDFLDSALAERIYHEVRRYIKSFALQDPKNMLNTFAYDRDTMLYYLSLWYGGREYREDRRRFRKIIEEAYSKINTIDRHLVEEIRRAVARIRKFIAKHIDCILYYLFSDTSISKRIESNILRYALRFYRDRIDILTRVTLPDNVETLLKTFRQVAYKQCSLLQTNQRGNLSQNLKQIPES